MLPPLRSQSDAVFYPGMWLSLFIGMQLEKISLAGRHFSGGDLRFEFIVASQRLHKIEPASLAASPRRLCRGVLGIALIEWLAPWVIR